MSYDIKKLFSGFLFLSSLTAAYTLHAQIAPSIEWEKSLGGKKNDEANSIQQTIDGGFIVAGSSYSNGGDVTGHHGSLDDADYWVVKLDPTGNLVWQKSLGGTGNDEAFSVQEIHDGGYIIAGASLSNDGDVSGNHGLGDFWIVKLDSAGNLIWQKCLGGSGGDWGNSIREITGGGFIATGYSASNDGDVTGNHGGLDFWVVKLDADANIVWQKSLGGSSWDYPHSVQQTIDGGFIVSGYSASSNGDVTANQGGEDYWIVKLDPGGNITWQKSFGGSGNDAVNSIQQTSDGEFIVAGFSRSYLNDGDVSGNHGAEDYWILKLDETGNLLWQKSLGGGATEVAYSIQQITDGFIVAGWSSSDDNDVQGNHGGGGDVWILKLDTAGNLVWQKCYGGTYYEEGHFIQQVAGGGFIIAGLAYSDDGDVSGHHGNIIHDDFWIVKLAAEIPTGVASPSNNFFSLYPNPVQTQLTLNLTIPPVEVRICVYDLQGKRIALPTTFTSTNAQLITTSLPDGFYTLQITNNKTGEIAVGKFVKQQ